MRKQLQITQSDLMENPFLRQEMARPRLSEPPPAYVRAAREIMSGMVISNESLQVFKDLIHFNEKNLHS